MNHDARRPEHQRDAGREHVLAELNDIAARGDEVVLGRAPQFPVVMLVGCARSGSTLFMQWLAASGAFAYPSNLMSRLWTSPRTGALLHRALIELDTRGEVFGRRPDAPQAFTSELGKTVGADRPHEYWYWWRRFLRYGELQQLTEAELEQVNASRMRAELADLVEVFAKPLAMKAHIANWNLPWLARVAPEVVFVHLERDTADNAASLLSARKRFFGDTTTWYSFKPPEYEALREGTPEEQTVGQVRSANRAAARLRDMCAERVLHIGYEAFCEAPERTWAQLSTLLAGRGVELPPYTGPVDFKIRHHPPSAAMQAALRSFPSPSDTP